MRCDDTIDALISRLDQQFRKNRNDTKARAMSDYMKGLFPFFGIASVERKIIQKAWFNTFDSTDRTLFWKLIHTLWDQNEREFQYVAIDLLNKQPRKCYNGLDAKEIESLITTKSWWDTVDLIASNYLGKYMLYFPELGKNLIHAWRNSDNLWLQRSCLIFQLKYGNKTDVALLKSLIQQYSGISEFFIQKAIGWSLRQLSKTNSIAVEEILEDITLKGIALREARKHLQE